MGAVLVVVIVLIVLLLGILVVSALRRTDLGTAIADALGRDRRTCATYGRSFSWGRSAEQFLAALAPIESEQAARRPALWRSRRPWRGPRAPRETPYPRRGRA